MTFEIRITADEYDRIKAYTKQMNRMKKHKVRLRKRGTLHSVEFLDAPLDVSEQIARYDRIMASRRRKRPSPIIEPQERHFDDDGNPLETPIIVPMTLQEKVSEFDMWFGCNITPAEEAKSRYHLKRDLYPHYFKYCESLGVENLPKGSFDHYFGLRAAEKGIMTKRGGEIGKYYYGMKLNKTVRLSPDGS